MKYKNNFNIEFDNEDIIGKIKDLKVYFRNEIINIVNNGDYDNDEVICYVNIVLNLLKDFEYENNEDKKIVIKDNPIGTYYYEDYKE